MTPIRRLDHVALVVSDTQRALEYFVGQLGLPVAHTEDLEPLRVRLTYLDVGNTFIQLVQPLDDESQVATSLRERGEGVHHICFGVRDVPSAVAALSGDGTLPPPLGQGRGRVSGFVAGTHHGLLIECTEFSFDEDVRERPGWLPDSETAPSSSDSAVGEPRISS